MAKQSGLPPKDPFASVLDMGGGGEGPRLPSGMIAKIVTGTILTLFVVAIAMTSYHTVQTEERGMVKRFGALVRVTEPGLHFKLPLGIETVENVPVTRILKQEFGFRTAEAGQRTEYSDADFNEEALMLTGDLNVISVEWVVQYQIDDPEKYLYRGLRRPEETLRDISETVMRRIIGNRLGSIALTTGRVEIASSVEEELQQIMRSYDSGIQIIRVELQDVTPPDPVKPSFNAVNESRQERERMINEAERERNERIPRAQGEARQTVAQAEGYAIERINRAKGEGSRFLEILDAYSKAPDVTRQRLYLEMIDRVVPRVGALYVMEEGQTQPLPLLNLNQNATGPRRTNAPAAAGNPAMGGANQ